MTLNSEIKKRKMKGYCCPIDTGPLSNHTKSKHVKKRIRQFLKNLLRKEIRDN